MRLGPREQPLWGVTGEGPELLCYLGRLPGTRILDFVNAFYQRCQELLCSQSL